MCHSKLKLGTIVVVLILEIAFTLGFIVTRSLINKVSKFPIICEYQVFPPIDQRINKFFSSIEI